MIKYVVGDLFEALPDDKVIMVPHIVNSIGGWGAGFVVPLGHTYPVAERSYREWYKKGESDSIWYDDSIPFELGKVQFVDCTEKIFVANMIGQEGVGWGLNGRPPIRYAALVECMKDVAEVTKILKAEIHAPAFGSGLAGGDFEFLKILIEEIWEDFDVTIYSLE
jgi:hypothetical protein